MPIYAITIRKSVPGYEWVNGWHVLAGTLSAAASAADAIATFEGAIHFTSVMIQSALVSLDPDPTHQEFQVREYGFMGGLGDGGNKHAPAEITAYCTLPTSKGRSGKKEFRYCINMSEYEGSGDGIHILSGPNVKNTIDANKAALFASLVSYNALLVVGKTFKGSVDIQFSKIGTLDTHKKYYDQKKKVG